MPKSCPFPPCSRGEIPLHGQNSLPNCYTVNYIGFGWLILNLALQLVAIMRGSTGIKDKTPSADTPEVLVSRFGSRELPHNRGAFFHYAARLPNSSTESNKSRKPPRPVPVYGCGCVSTAPKYRVAKRPLGIYTKSRSIGSRSHSPAPQDFSEGDKIQSKTTSQQAAAQKPQGKVLHDPSCPQC